MINKNCFFEIDKKTKGISLGEIKKQGIQNSIISYIGIVLGFINLIVVMPHFLEPEEIGLTRVLFSFSVLLATLFPLGIGNVTTKYFPLFNNKSKGHFGYFGFMSLFALVGYIICAIIIYFFKDLLIAQYSKQSALFVEYFYFVFPFTFILGFISLLNVYCFSLYKTTLPTLLNDVSVRILSIILFAVYFLKLIDLDVLILLFVTIYCLQLFILLGYIFYIDRPKLKIDLVFLKEQNISGILKYGFFLSLASFSSLALKYLDTIILAAYFPLATAGIFAVAAFIPTVIEAPIGALEKITNAKIADAFIKNDLEEIKTIYYKSTRYLFVLGGLLFVGVSINIEDLLSLLPNDYSEGVNVVLIMSLSALINMATGVNNAIVFNSRQYIYGTYMLYLLVIISFINYLIFIPLFGMEGAAFATALSSFIYNLLKYLFIWKKFNMQPYDRSSLIILLIIIVCLFAGIFTPETPFTMLTMTLKSIGVAILYGAMVLYSKIVPELNEYFQKQK